MTQNESKDLVTCEVQKCIENLLTKLDYKNFKFDISAGSIRGDNYLGVIAKVTGTGEDQNGKSKKFDLIVKSAPRNEGFRAFAPVHLAYEREIYVYAKVLPEFAKFQEERGVLRPFKSYAKYYESTMNNLNEALIMENMKALGYDLFSRFEPLDYGHTVLVLREYGKFHAISYALRDQKPELFKEFCSKTQENFFSDMGDDQMRKTIEKQSEKALESLDPIANKEEYEKFKNFRTNIVGLFKESARADGDGKYAVIGHGDCWINNFLFKYKDSSKTKEPTDLCILDWQLARIGSPALDLAYFIFTSTDKELRDKHYKDLIKEYYKSLCGHLKELGSDPDKAFPFAVLEEHLKKYSAYGLYMAVLLLFIMTSEVDEIPDIHDLATNESIMDKFNYDSKNMDKYHDRIRGVILDFHKFGYQF